MYSKRICTYRSDTLSANLLVSVNSDMQPIYEITLNNKHWRSFTDYSDAVKVYSQKVLTHTLVICPINDNFINQFF